LWAARLAHNSSEARPAIASLTDEGRIDRKFEPPYFAGTERPAILVFWLDLGNFGQCATVVPENFNLSEIIGFAEALKGLANPMLSVLFLFVSTLFSLPFARRSPSGDFVAATPDRCARALFQTAELDRGGPRLLGVVVRSLDRLAIGAGHRQTADGHRLAP
jgi:hypothetical protein